MHIEKLYNLFREAGAVSTDTRNLIPGSIFFALKGANFNGNEFADRALQEGCSWAVIDEAPEKPNEKSIVVSDVLETLQDLARYHRQQFDIPFIGLTGSNGKTTTKELMAAVLKQKFNVHATRGNLNNHIGVPLTLLALSDNTEIAIIEMGANRPNDIGELCDICQPTHGLITNIGRAHLEGFGSLDGVARAKGQLFEFLASRESLIFLHSSDPKLSALAEGLQTFTYSTDQTAADVRGELVDRGLTVSFSWSSRDYQSDTIRTQLTGSYNLSNLMAAAAVGEFFDVPGPAISDALQNYNPHNNRSQVKRTASNTLILDAYNANPTSVEKALNDFNAIEVSGPKFAILGDMLEVGKESEEAHKSVIQFLQKNAIPAILVGPLYKAALKEASGYKAFENVEKAKDYLARNPIKHHHILVKGSRGIQLEKLTENL